MFVKVTPRGYTGTRQLATVHEQYQVRIILSLRMKTFQRNDGKYPMTFLLDMDPVTVRL